VTAESRIPAVASRFASLDAVRDLLARQEDLPPGALQAIQALSGELRRATEELSDADARYRAVVERIPAIVYTDVVDDTMTTIYVSPQIEELLGILPEEYIADPDLWAKQLHPDDKEHALQS
jgi:PAS domain-containing protein